MATQAQVVAVGEPIATGQSAFFSEAFTLYARSIRKLIRRPIFLYFSLFQPFIWLVLFGQLFNRLFSNPAFASQLNGKSYFQFFLPAVIMQTILFGAAQSGIAILADKDSGFLDKMLTTPINRLAILMGQVMSDLTRMLIQTVILVVLAVIFGLLQDKQVSFTYGLPGILAALLIAMLLGLGLAGLGVFISLSTGNTQTSFLIANFLTLPLLFVSPAQVPLALLPDWMQTVAALNPVTYAIDTMRFFLNGQPLGENEMVKAFVVLGGIAIVTLALAVRSFRRVVR